MTPVTDWTQDILQWDAWVLPVSDEALTPKRKAVLETFPNTGNSTYYRVLVHEPRILRHRTDLFNESIRGEVGLGRADRELAAVGSSRATGCVYCASVHARAYSGLVRERSLVQRVLDEGPDAAIPERERSIVQFSAKLGLEPDQIDSADLQPLRDQGFSDGEILDIAHAAAIFANANRLMLTLGEAARP